MEAYTSTTTNQHTAHITRIALPRHCDNSRLTCVLVCLCAVYHRTMYTVWLADADWVSDGQGGYEMRPHQMVLASAYGDAVRVDEWPREDEMPPMLTCSNTGQQAGPPETRWKQATNRGVQIETA